MAGRRPGGRVSRSAALASIFSISVGMLARHWWEIRRKASPRRKFKTFPPRRCLAECEPMSVNPDADAALMLRVKRGDDAAFAELVDKYKQPVMNLAYRILRDATEAEDVAQNVFLQAYKSAPRYEVSAKFSTWLFTIARNLCLNEIRRRSRHPADSLDASPYPASED